MRNYSGEHMSGTMQQYCLLYRFFLFIVQFDVFHVYCRKELYVREYSLIDYSNPTANYQKNPPPTHFLLLLLH